MENSGLGTGLGLLRELLASSTQQRLMRELTAGSNTQRSVLAQPSVAGQLADRERLKQQSAERASRRVFAEIYGRSALGEEGPLHAAASRSRAAAQRHLQDADGDAASACSISRDAAWDSDRSRQSPFSSAHQDAGQKSHRADHVACPAAGQAGGLGNTSPLPAKGSLPAALLQPYLPWTLHTISRPCLSLELLMLLQLAAIVRQSMPQLELARSAVQLHRGNEPLLIYALFLLMQSAVLRERSHRHLMKSLAKRSRRNSRKGQADEHNRAFHEAFLAG